MRAKEEAVGGSPGLKKGGGGPPLCFGSEEEEEGNASPSFLLAEEEGEGRGGEMACSFIHAPLVKIKEGEYECVYSCFFSYYLCNNRDLLYLP